MKTDSSGFFDAADIEPSRFSPEADYIIGEEMYSSEKGFTRINLVRRLGRLFIAKSLRAEYRAEMVAQSALRKEFEIGFAIDCPGAVRTFDFPTHPELGAFIVLEYCRGENLRQFLSSGRELSGEMLRKISDSLISTLRILHSQGIIHRDIKPSNIIFDEISGSVKLIDFGCADTFDQLMFKGRAGTELYQSEDFENLPAADWYALSLSLSELLGHCSYPKAIEHVSSLCAAMREGRDPVETSPGRSGRGRHLLLMLATLVGVVMVVSLALYYHNREEQLPAATERNETADIKAGPDSLTLAKPPAPAQPPLSPDENNTLPSPETVSSPSEKAPEPSAPSSEPKIDRERALTARETEKTTEPPAAAAPSHDKKLLPPEEVAIGMSPYVADSVYNTTIAYMHNRAILGCREVREDKKRREELLKKQYRNDNYSFYEECKLLYDKETLKEDVYKKVLPLPLGVSRDSVMRIVSHYVRIYF